MTSFIPKRLRKKDVDYLVRELAAAREIEAEYKKQLCEIQADIDAQFALVLKTVKDSLETAKTEVADLENEVRRAGLERYEKFGDKQVHPAVLVEERLKLNYCEEEAKEYAMDQARHCLNVKLLKAKFKKVALANELSFVTTGKERRAKIKTDLSAYLDGGNDG